MVTRVTTVYYPKRTTANTLANRATHKAGGGRFLPRHPFYGAYIPTYIRIIYNHAFLPELLLIP
jgi:hypothetical protein